MSKIRRHALWAVLGALLGVVAGAAYKGLSPEAHATQEARADVRGLMVCAFDVGPARKTQVLSFVPGWEPPESWRCSVIVEPREWRPADKEWRAVLSLEVGEACGWREPAAGCCPECLTWEEGCPKNAEGCRATDSR